MLENEKNSMEESVKNALAVAMACVEEYKGSRVRTSIFKQFEDADYYYKKKAVQAVAESVDAASASGDEIFEVNAYANMYRLLSVGFNKQEKVNLFIDCYCPLLDVLKTDEARGLQNYLMGCRSAELELAESSSYFKSAIELDNENVLADKVFKENPEMIFHWLKCFIGIQEKQGRFSEYEALLNSLVKDAANAGDFYFKLANLFKDNALPQADGYFRKCINLGYRDVVDSQTFYKTEYETDYIKWFNAVPKTLANIKESIAQCFSKLWASAAESAFSCSKQAATQKLLELDFAAGCKVYGRFADAGHKWAEQWLLEHSEEPSVQVSISDDIIAKWFNAKESERKAELALGALFVAGRCRFLDKNQKYYLLISKYYFEKKNYLAALSFFLKMFSSKDFAPCDFKSFEANLRRVVKDKYLEIIENSIRKNGLWIDVPMQMEEVLTSMNISKCRPFDANFLSDYFAKGCLPAVLFRQDSEAPCCTRYFLLRQMACMVEKAVVTGLSDAELNIFKAQGEQFKRQAQVELDDAIAAYDVMAVFVWIVDKFSQAGENDRKMAISTLFTIISLVKPGKMQIPYLLLANFLSRFADSLDPAVVAIRWVLENDAEVDAWCTEQNAEKLFKKVFEKL